MIHLKHIALASVALSVAACGRQAPSPTDPTLVITRFMNAVNAEDFGIMGETWGTNDGPASEWMAPDELRQRLTVMQAFLVHEAFEVVPGQPMATGGGRLVFRVRIVTPNGCEPIVSYTVVPHRGEWLLEAVDLPAVQPTRVCP